ncbi:MAG: AbrB/MazE/SpoVT family DNA-binding domain-containing protein [archaeon]
MKAVGIVRRIDDLGRVVIPKELRRTMEMGKGCPVEIFVEDDGKVILKKFESGCIFCNETEKIVNYKGKNICKKCIKEMGEKGLDMDT